MGAIIGVLLTLLIIGVCLQFGSAVGEMISGKKAHQALVAKQAPLKELLSMISWLQTEKEIHSEEWWTQPLNIAIEDSWQGMERYDGERPCDIMVQLERNLDAEQIRAHLV